jgi:hypothetical protein
VRGTGRCLRRLPQGIRLLRVDQLPLAVDGDGTARGDGAPPHRFARDSRVSRVTSLRDKCHRWSG